MRRPTTRTAARIITLIGLATGLGMGLSTGLATGCSSPAPGAGLLAALTADGGGDGRHLSRG